MSNNHLTIKSSLIAAVAFSLNVGASDHKEPSKDYVFSTQELNALSKANLTRLSDDQFVFNNDLPRFSLCLKTLQAFENSNIWARAFLLVLYLFVIYHERPSILMTHVKYSAEYRNLNMISGT